MVFKLKVENMEFGEMSIIILLFFLIKKESLNENLFLILKFIIISSYLKSFYIKRCDFFFNFIIIDLKSPIPSVFPY